MIKKIILLFCLTLVLTNATAKKRKVAVVGFYNLENLFDTINTPDVKDEEFLPSSDKAWNTKKYYHKLNNMSSVIAQLGGKFAPNGPAILGVCEVENKQVLCDLTQMPILKKAHYKIVHKNSPDRRGIDVGLLYNEKAFKVTNNKSYRLKVSTIDNFRSRDQLLVSGLLYGDKVHFIVNHWPSRYGGEERSRPLRNEAAKLCKSIIDSIHQVEPDAKIMVMGDFNDDPINESISTYLDAKPSKSETKKGDLFNPMDKLFSDGIGSLAYRGNWNLFDMIIVSEALLNSKKGLKFESAKVFNDDFLRVEEGKYKGYPKRSFVGSKFHGGYSDHFPVFIQLVK